MNTKKTKLNAQGNSINPLLPAVFSKEDVIAIIEKRRMDAFANDFHNHENLEMLDAIDVIKRLIPPSYFPNGR
jgi:hypothetical protein